jgi:hydrogenase maturation factor
MKFRFTVVAGTVMSLLFAAVTLVAHHSNAAQFDSTKRQTITGEITKVEWTNPHAFIHVSVKDASGKVITWQLEGFPPLTLLRTGWSQKDLKQGDKISVEGCIARDGSSIMLAREVTLVDGRKLYWGPAA